MARRKKKTSAQQLKIAQRRRQAVQLRLAGLTGEEIADQLHVNASTIYQDLEAVMAISSQESSKELRAWQQQRYENLLSIVYPQALGGNLRAVDRVLAILAHQNKLLGIDAPQRLAMTTPDGAPAQDAVSPDQMIKLLDDEIAKLVAKAQERQEEGQ